MSAMHNIIICTRVGGALETVKVVDESPHLGDLAADGFYIPPTIKKEGSNVLVKSAVDGRILKIIKIAVPMGMKF